MYYVEFLRVLRTLRIVGLVLAAVILLSLVLRPFSHGGFNETGTIAGVDASKVSVRVNADGSQTRSFTGTHGQHVTIVVHPDRTETITVDDPAYAGKKDEAQVQIGPVKVKTTRSGRHRVSTITNDMKLPFSILVLISGCAAAIVATLFGLALSRENDGHLELAWTKPASRETYALTAVAMDVAGILATGLSMLFTILLVLAVYGGFPYLVAGDHALLTALFSIFFALSFYGIVLAATSSMRRGGLVLSLLWPAALILPGLVRVEWMNLGTVARTLNTVNPVAYLYAFATSPEATRLFTLMPNGAAIQFLAPLVLFIAGVMLSLAQWRRLEA
ncbi:MAG: hypothetical protein ABR584_03320 [Candidatus Baltobacteraceae bacterium]